MKQVCTFLIIILLITVFICFASNTKDPKTSQIPDPVNPTKPDPEPVTAILSLHIGSGLYSFKEVQDCDGVFVLYATILSGFCHPLTSIS